MAGHHPMRKAQSKAARTVEADTKNVIEYKDFRVFCVVADSIQYTRISFYVCIVFD